MEKFLKTTLCATAMTLAAVGFAQAQDATFGATALGQIDSGSQAIAAMVEDCAAPESSGRAVMACTKLMRLTTETELKASLMTQRAMHRVAQGNHNAASEDFKRAADLSNDTSLSALSDGFAGVARQDFAMAQASFEDCRAQGELAKVAEYGLSLTRNMARQAGTSATLG